MMVRGLSGKLKAERERRNFTQEEVAARLDINKSMVSKYERGESTPPPEILMKLATMYGVSTDYLLGLTEDRSVSIAGLKEEQIKIVLSLIDMFQKYNDSNK